MGYSIYNACLALAFSARPNHLQIVRADLLLFTLLIVFSKIDRKSLFSSISFRT